MCPRAHRIRSHKAILWTCEQLADASAKSRHRFKSLSSRKQWKKVQKGQTEVAMT